MPAEKDAANDNEEKRTKRKEKGQILNHHFQWIHMLELILTSGMEK